MYSNILRKRGGEGVYHIGESKALDTSFTDHGHESPDDIIRIEEVPGPAVGQYGCNNISTQARFPQAFS